jgi:hypothetical protein
MTKTNSSSSLGIWMDHSVAHLIEFSEQTGFTTTLQPNLTREQMNHHLSKGDYHKHQLEQHRQKEFYTALSKVILNYDKVLLFGPTEAKVELFHLLEADSHFDNKIIEMKQADKMTEHQQHAFVLGYFLKHPTV